LARRHASSCFAAAARESQHGAVGQRFGMGPERKRSEAEEEGTTL